MRRSYRRVFILFLGLPLVILGLAWLYMIGMDHLEGSPRTYSEAVEWASETITGVGYGGDAKWQHPMMVGFVTVVQFLGLTIVFLVFPLIVLPFFEERFEGRLPRTIPKIRDHVLIYRYGPAVASLLDELEAGGVETVIFEEDDDVARQLRDRGHKVIYGRQEHGDPEPNIILRARALIANGSDADNGAFVLSARQQGFEGDLFALVENPTHRRPMMLAGASAAFTPRHVLAAALAAMASERISPRVAGIQHLGGRLAANELRIDKNSEIAGKTLAEAKIRARTGATIIGQWVGGEFVQDPSADTLLQPGAILIAVGPEAALKKLEELATPLRREGPFLVAGFGEVGTKLVQLLTDAGEQTLVIDKREKEGVDFVGDALDQELLQKAEVEKAHAVILSLNSDSATLFAASVVRGIAPDVPIIARVNREQNVERIHRAGADFALSLGKVSGQLLAHQLLGDSSIRLERGVKLIKVVAAELAGKNPWTARVRERTGCSVVAVERGEEVFVEYGPEFALDAEDSVYVVGSADAVSRYFGIFPGAKPSPRGTRL